jgi:hypothetical protein
MTSPSASAPDPGPAPDLEYDLAHEVTAPGAPYRDAAPVQVSTQTDHDGDYGYDLAHDIPRG